MTAILRAGEPLGAPCMVRHINIGTLWSLPAWSSAPPDLTSQLIDLTHCGVVALQLPRPELVAGGALPVIGQARVQHESHARRVAKEHRRLGCGATTLHVGTGFESDKEMDRLVESVIDASLDEDYPLFVETHRATITQDMKRTLDLVERLPAIRFNADLSHWYTGQEMTYGDLQAKFDALTPIFERVRYMHGRIGTPCCAQVGLTGPHDDRGFVDDFREMWRRCASGFLKTAQPGEILPFAPELLPHSMSFPGGSHYFYYARTLDLNSIETEETDRWEQAAFLWQIAEASAQAAGLALGRHPAL